MLDEFIRFPVYDDTGRFMGNVPTGMALEDVRRYVEQEGHIRICRAPSFDDAMRGVDMDAKLVTATLVRYPAGDHHETLGVMGYAFQAASPADADTIRGWM